MLGVTRGRCDFFDNFSHTANIRCIENRASLTAHKARACTKTKIHPRVNVCNTQVHVILSLCLRYTGLPGWARPARLYTRVKTMDITSARNTTMRHIAVRKTLYIETACCVHCHMHRMQYVNTHTRATFGLRHRDGRNDVWWLYTHEEITEIKVEYFIF